MSEPIYRRNMVDEYRKNIRETLERLVKKGIDLQHLDRELDSLLSDNGFEQDELTREKPTFDSILCYLKKEDGLVYVLVDHHPLTGKRIPHLYAISSTEASDFAWSCTIAQDLAQDRLTYVIRKAPYFFGGFLGAVGIPIGGLAIPIGASFGYLLGRWIRYVIDDFTGQRNLGKYLSNRLVATGLSALSIATGIDESPRIRVDIPASSAHLDDMVEEKKDARPKAKFLKAKK